MAGYFNLSNIHKDALKEIGNIGAGSAATAFAQFLNRKINMTVPAIEILPITEVPEETGGVEETVIAVLLTVLGEAPGKILLVFSEESILYLLKLVFNKEVSEIGDLEISAIKEIGNILSGSYLNALNQMTGFNLTQTVPAYAHDMAGAVLSSSLIDLSQESDYALLIKTLFISDCELEGYFFLIPDAGSLDKILQSLGFDI